MKAVLLFAAAMGLSSPVIAQSVTNVAPDSVKGAPVQRLLVDGYEVKTGFSDNSGGAYIILQKATSAYMCHSNPIQTCEKLN